MAERAALFHVATKKAKKPKQRTRGETRRAAPAPEAPWYRRLPGGLGSGSRPARGGGRAPAPGSGRTTGPGTSRTAGSSRAAGKGRTAGTGGFFTRGRAGTGAGTGAAAGAGTRGRTRRSTTAPAPRPDPPVLQRRSLGSTLARAAVLTAAIVCMVGFAVALAKVTLVPSPSSDALVHTNLRPGASIRAYLDQPALRDSVKQIGGNILLGVPFGILLPMLFPRARGLLRVAVVTAVVMVLVESAQGAIVEGRAFDIDDVILNTAGALLGYLLLGRRLGRALHPRRTHWYHHLGFGQAPRD